MNKVEFALCLILIPLFICPFSARSQDTYRPFIHDSITTVDLLAKTTRRLESDKAAIKGENKKYIVSEFQDRFDHIKQMYDRKNFITDPVAKKYMDSLLAIILKSNPFLQPLQPRVLFSRLYWPNAGSFGEGTIMFNASLFNRLRNESQAAFIICHELSHYYLDHGNRAIHQYVNTLYSEDFQQQLKDIKRSEYQKGRSLDKLVKTISYKNRRHGRDHETEADSLALEMLKNTGFDVREALTSLALLDSVDKEKYKGSLHLAEQFNFAEYPFRQSWIRKTGLSLGEAIAAHGISEDAGKEMDSLKTHPDCSVRVMRLQKRAQDYYQAGQKPFLVNSATFNKLVNCFDYELIEYCYQSDQIGRAMYYALQMQYHHKQNDYLVKMIGKCLNRIYQAQRDHTLSKIADLNTTPDNPEYDEYLRFLQALKLPDIAAINYYFMKQYYPAFNSDTDFMTIYNNSVSVYKSLK